MIEDKKYALLDTDFLYKSYLAQDDAQNTLADIVISFQEYEFFCHSIGFGNQSNLDDGLSNYGIPKYHLRYFTLSNTIDEWPSDPLNEKQLNFIHELDEKRTEVHSTIFCGQFST